MAEYIEREAFYRFLTEQKDKETGAYSKGRNAGLDVARSALHNKEITPAADVVAVVRCKDCKYYGDTAYGDMCKRWEDWLPTEDDDFCSYGDRRGDNEL